MTFLNLLEYQSGKSTNYIEISFLFHSKVEELKQSLKLDLLMDYQMQLILEI